MLHFLITGLLNGLLAEMTFKVTRLLVFAGLTKHRTCQRKYEQNKAEILQQQHHQANLIYHVTLRNWLKVVQQ